MELVLKYPRVENLEEQMYRVDVCFFNFIKQQDRIWVLLNKLGESSG